MSTKKANRDSMEGLHAVICKQLTEIITSGKMFDAKSGTDVQIPASYFQAAISFLRDNDIKGLPVEGSPLSKLLASVDFESLQKDIEATQLQ